MTVWFVIPAARETQFRTFYSSERVRGRDNLDKDERVGQMIVGAAGNLMTGTTRLSSTAQQRLDGRKPVWLEIYTTFPPPGAWEYPPAGDDARQPE